MIDPELRARGLLMKAVNRSFTEDRFRLINRAMRWSKPKLRAAELEISEERLPRRDGSGLRILVMRPRTRASGIPGVLWLHGGGYAIGRPEQAFPIARHLIRASRCVVIAPAYRLSLSAPYPAALEDAYATLLWMKSNSIRLGIGEDQLMVGGHSAGGGLAAALTLCARDRGEVSLAFQMPLYPMLDDRMRTESARDNDAPVWDSESNAVAWRLYLGERAGLAGVPAYAAPSRATDFRGLPPAVSFVGSLDPFRDETQEYMENLRNAGVPVEFRVFEGCYHGFDQVCPDARVSRDATSLVVEAFTKAVSRHFVEPPPAVFKEQP